MIKFDEIMNYEWKIPKYMEIKNINLNSLTLEEQEIIILQGRLDKSVDIDCSSQPWITTLSKNPSFELHRVILSPKREILQVRGELPLGAITLRRMFTRKPICEAKKKELVERLKKARKIKNN